MSLLKEIENRGHSVELEILRRRNEEAKKKKKVKKTK